MTDTRTTTIPFSGFYESHHNARFDDTLEQMHSGDDDAFNAVDWRKVHLAYAQLYASKLADECSATWEFAKLDSPRFYNFRTDEIEVQIAIDELRRMFAFVPSDTLAALIADRLAPRSGFIPFYSDKLSDWGALETWDAPQLALLVECYCDQYCDNEARDLYLVDDCNGEITAMIDAAQREVTT